MCTYGCQMNVHDSDRIASLLDEAGYAPVADGAQPDVVVFSTCADGLDPGARSSARETNLPGRYPPGVT